ncbi:MAG: acyl-ACP--UDP-N-acetylglucosamine O-acyltransferase, partial [Alphaproteobacteria bacterium]
MSNIHPTSVIEPGAQLADDVSVGPFCYIGAGVTLHEGVKIFSHVSLNGDTQIGANTEVYSFACLGHPPQHHKYQHESCRLRIGRNNIIREHVTIHPGTPISGETTIGDNCFIMVSCHIAHDCHVGNHVTFANNATLGGHVIVEDHVILGGLVAIHQHVRIGAHAIIGGMSGVENDVIPFGVVMGDRANLTGLNLVGLKRRGFAQSVIQELRQAYNQIFIPEPGSGGFADRVREVAELSAGSAEVMNL